MIIYLPAIASKTAQTTQIREFVENDRKELEEFWETIWCVTYGPVVGRVAFNLMLTALGTSGMRNMLPSDDEKTFVAVLNSEIIGSAILAERGFNAYLWGMYVHPDHQRRGIGTALLRHATKTLTGSTAIKTTILTSSIKAVAFYQRYGFKKLRREPAQPVIGCSPVPSLVMVTSQFALHHRLRQYRRYDEQVVNFVSVSHQSKPFERENI